MTVKNLKFWIVILNFALCIFNYVAVATRLFQGQAEAGIEPLARYYRGDEILSVRHGEIVAVESDRVLRTMVCRRDRRPSPDVFRTRDGLGFDECDLCAILPLLR